MGGRPCFLHRERCVSEENPVFVDLPVHIRHVRGATTMTTGVRTFSIEDNLRGAPGRSCTIEQRPKVQKNSGYWGGFADITRKTRGILRETMSRPQYGGEITGYH